MNNQLIIFSKNRACQLDLLLNSIYLNSNGIFDEISVIYTNSDELFGVGYEILIKEHSKIKFIKEKDFRNDLFSLINEKNEFTTFMVDDIIFYDSVSTSKDNLLSSITNNHICFSLRLGLNCNYSHPANLSYSIGEHERSNGFLTFDYTKQSLGDFKYPLSVDGHVFNTYFLLNLLTKIQFNNPNTLESGLQRFCNQPQLPKLISCFEKSKIVGVPVNLVNNTHNNRHGLKFGVSTNELNHKFTNNLRIDIDKIDLSEINGPHKEIKYEFKGI